MRKTTTVQWKLIIAVQLELVILTKQSIEGVTYMSHFDFEQRYSNDHECDPFYWYPLHLPEHCTKMFEDLIRSRVAAAAQAPVRLVRRRPIPNIYSLNPIFGNYEEDSADDEYNPSKNNRYKYKGLSEEDTEAMTPFEELFYLLRKDAKKNPIAPSVKMAPNFGPVAVYKQPISKRSEKLIKKMARAYVKSGYGNDETESYYSKIDINHPSNPLDINSQRPVTQNKNGFDIILNNKKRTF